MKKRYLTTAAALSSLLFSCGSDNLTGNVEGTDTGTLVTPAGTPVSNASVRVYTYKDSTGVWEDSLTTDENGTYSLSGLDAGRYSVWAETDSSVLFLESVSIDEDSKFADTDTMQAYKSVSVPVKIQPNHNPQTVEVQIWGTPIRHNVNEEGLLVLNKIPVGEYFTRLTSTLDGYSPTNDTLLIDSDASGKLDDTLELIYTGIPVVSGIEASYDTLNGVATIEWDATDFHDLDGYLIYRDPVGAIDLSTDPIGFTSDTRFEDNSNHMENEKLVYRVAIRANNENEVGPVFYKDTIDYVSSDEFLNLVEIDSAVAYTNRTLSVEYNTPSWIGEVASVSWNIADLDISGTGSDGKITFTVPANKLFEKLALTISMNGSDDRVLYDTISVSIQPKIEKIEGTTGVAGTHTTPVILGNTLYLKGRNKSPEIWKTEDGINWHSCGILDTATYTHDVSNLAVWNEQLWFVSGKGELFKSADGISWEKEIDLYTSDSISKYHSVINFENRLVIFKESGVYGDSMKRYFTRLEYDGEVTVKQLSYEGGFTPQIDQDSILIYGYSNEPVIANGNLYISLRGGPAGQGAYKIKETLFEDFYFLWDDPNHDYMSHTYGTSYANGTVINAGSTGLTFLPDINFPEGISENTMLIDLDVNFEKYLSDKTSYVFNGKLMVVTDKGVYSDSPME